jgi:hypothetical protein
MGILGSLIGASTKRFAINRQALQPLMASVSQEADDGLRPMAERLLQQFLVDAFEDAVQGRLTWPTISFEAKPA